METESGDVAAAAVWVKVGVFVAVQALIYFILSKSSDLFSGGSGTPPRSGSFKRARTLSIRRIVAAFSDFPVGVDSSPVSADD
ncbi:unnamed protein product [Cuscuta campestris]|uniref:Uncharacterized protein n=1 Tax=Cuscuta campestris TaxID=132261 RepID=A0A484LHQ8_9ASTE|nr:unnamed protein product [Cuscuta campestris]